MTVTAQELLTALREIPLGPVKRRGGVESNRAEDVIKINKLVSMLREFAVQVEANQRQLNTLSGDPEAGFGPDEGLA